MIRALLSIIQKNFKTLGRSKFSLIAIILVPLLVILLTGFAFNSSGLSGISVGTYSNSYSELTESILQGLEAQNFTINKLDSNESCINSVKKAETQICIIFPQDLSEEGSSDEVMFYVDQSRLNLAYTLIHEVNIKISATSSELGISLAQELIQSLNLVKVTLPNQNLDLELSKNNLQTIIDRTSNNISLEDIENATSYLTTAMGLTNESSVQTRINKTILILEELNSTLLSTYNSLDYIKNQSESTKSTLSSVSNNFNALISDLNQTNIAEAENIVSPIKTKIESVNVDANNKDYFVPAIIALIALFGSILLSSTFVLQERKSKAYFRKFLTPVSDFAFLLGNYFTCLIMLLAQFVLVFAGVIWILQISILSVWPSVLLVLFLALSAFTFIGMFIGYLFRSEETTIFAGVLVAALMMFFSNTILPIETISSNFRNIAIFNPLVACDAAFKKIILFNLKLSVISTEIYVLAGFFVVFAILSYIGRRITKRML